MQEKCTSTASSNSIAAHTKRKLPSLVSLKTIISALEKTIHKCSFTE